MKRLTLSALALVLATGTGTALADRGHGDHHRGKHGHGHGHKHGHYNRHWYPRPYYQRMYYYPHHEHHSDYYAPLGAALIGAAVTYSLFHRDDAGYRSSGSSDVVGCHRIERYPDGSERRVEVPLAECY
ncbi:MAG TPA: hypothetical protein VIV27_03245 [Halioglobus sp.]